MRFLPFIFLFSLLFGLIQPELLAQTVPDTSRTVEADLERILEDFDPDDPDIDPELLAQFLIELAQNPININRAGIGDLLLVPGVNSRIAQNILAYRQSKPFETIEELLQVNGIGRATLERMRPYVTIGRSGELTRLLLTSPRYWLDNGRFEMFSRMQTVVQQQTGYTEPEFEDQTRYAGSSLRYYQRFNYSTRRLSLNLTQLKDPGEALTGPTDFDFNSWHVAVQNVGYLQQLVIGDYGIWAGQGLVLWTGLAFGKGSDVIRVGSRSERGLRPYQSSEETRFMRGVAATIGRDLQFTAFYSNRPLSATVVQGDSIRFPSSTGFHRTPTELARRFNTNLEIYGGRIRYASSRFILGATGYLAEYDKYILPATGISNRYDFEGTTASTFGVDYRLFLGPVSFYGEGARSRNGGLGFVSGLEYPIDNNTSLNITYRNYARDFQSLYGQGFGESSGFPRNEEGLYVGLAHRLTSQIFLSGYFDSFTFPAPRFGTRQSTRGYDWLALGELRFNRSMNAYIMARSKIRGNDYTLRDEFGREVTVLGDDIRTSIRSQFEYQISPNVRSRTRLEWARARDRNSETEYGVMMFQDIRWSALNNLTVDVRLAVFETDGFSSRIFSFENDLLYVFSIAALAGQGQRGYVLLRYTPTSYMDIWLKYAATIYEDRQVVGSGLDQSIGNVRSQVGAQVRLRF